MLATVCAYIMFAIMNAIAKHLSQDYSIIEIVFYRNIVAVIPFLLVASIPAKRDIVVIQSKPGLVMLRAVLGVVSLALTFAAFSEMPMAETSVLLFTSSLFLPILGIIFLKEHVGKFRWMAIIIGFCGVLLMTNPDIQITTLGVIFAISAALIQAVMSVVARHLGRYEKPEVTTFYFFTFGALAATILMPFMGKLPDISDIPFLIAVGLSGALAQWLYVVGLKYTPAAIVAVINYSNIIWALILGWLIWNDWPLPIVFVSTAIIIFANVIMVWREQYRSGLT